MDLETDKKQSAYRQIEQAIAMLHAGHLDCAITLGAAAEGMIHQTDKPHIYRFLRDHPKNKEWDINAVINWLKHWNAGEPYRAVIQEFEATLVVARGITKFMAAFAERPQMFVDFFAQAEKNGHMPKVAWKDGALPTEVE